jgi:hypothetical protein
MTSAKILAAFCAGLALGPGVAAAAAAPHAYHAPRTVHGQPDLQGIWTNVTVTRLERRPGAALTVPPEREAAEERAQIESFMHPPGDIIDARATEWQPLYRAARIGGRVRTSFIVSPADGRLPYRPGVREAIGAKLGVLDEVTDNPEDRLTGERCLTGAGGPPIVNPNAAGAKQIVQTGDEVAILSESNHDVRIVRLGSPGHPPVHAPAAMRTWMGDSIGWWEKDTLVVETINLHPEETLRQGFALSPAARITERFTRTSNTELLYSYEVDDPATYTQVWRAELPFMADPAPIFEYACNEGNYSLEGILAGARRVEADAAAARNHEKGAPGGPDAPVVRPAGGAR